MSCRITNKTEEYCKYDYTAWGSISKLPVSTFRQSLFDDPPASGMGGQLVIGKWTKVA